MSKVIILGAGSSAYAGVPLQEKFLKEIIDFLDEYNVFTDPRKNSHIKPFKHLLSEIEGNHFANNIVDIDLLFSALDFLIDINTDKCGLGQRLRAIDADVKTNIETLASAISKKKRNISPEINGEKIKKLLSKSITNLLQPHILNTGRISDRNNIMLRFFKDKIKLQENDTIVSFNYDLLADVALWTLEAENNKIWSPVDGYALGNSINHRLEENEEDEDNFLDKFLKMCGKSKVKLLKVHGSINWVDYSLGNQLDILCIATHEKRFGRCYFHGIENTKHIINDICFQNDDEYYNAWNRNGKYVLFGYLKKELFTNLWKKAEKSMRMADEIVITGYSFPDADEDSRKLIENASAEASVTIIGKNYEEADKIKNKIEKIRGANKFGNIVPLDKSFEEFVMSHDEISEPTAEVSPLCEKGRHS